MQIVGTVFLLFTGLLLFFGSLFIIFFDKTNLSHLFLFYLVVIPTVYLIYFVIQFVSKKTPQKENKVSESIDASALDTKSQRLENINPTLMTIESIFPLELFPDTLKIEASSITLARRNFFKTGWTEVVTTDQITAVEIVAGPIFAAIIVKRGLMEPMEIDNLWKADAVKAKMLLEELVLKEGRNARSNSSQLRRT